jgi:hypothetical protein
VRSSIVEIVPKVDLKIVGEEVKCGNVFQMNQLRMEEENVGKGAHGGVEIPRSGVVRQGIVSS